MSEPIPVDCGLTGLTFVEPSLCRFEFAAECDLRNIIRKFLRTGQLPESRMDSGITDASRLPDDFMELQNSAIRIRQGFDRLPLEIRNEYNNDPLAWLDAEARKEASQSQASQSQASQSQASQSVGDSKADTSTGGESAAETEAPPVES